MNKQALFVDNEARKVDYIGQPFHLECLSGLIRSALPTHMIFSEPNDFKSTILQYRGL